MKIGFYAPLKPPDSPIPSGDRQMAKLLLSSLRSQGHDVRLLSRFKSREPDGVSEIQKKISAHGNQICNNLIKQFSNKEAWRPDLWFTYHMFYKAPDFLGPKVSEALGIPYVVAEASHAPKRANGRWRVFHQQIEKTFAHADLIIGLNSNDRACVQKVINNHACYAELKPFVRSIGQPNSHGKKFGLRQALKQKHGIPLDSIWLLTVGMMRQGAKLKSYKVLADALKRLSTDKNWNIIIIGDGPQRAEVENLFNKNTFFIGELLPGLLSSYYDAADLFLWPAVEEAYGMALLEAQFAGLPAIAGNSGGVKDILRDEVTGLLCEEGDAVDFARATDVLLESSTLREKMSMNAHMIMNQEHDFKSNSEKLGVLIRHACQRYKIKK
jgi:glycosyltransferase involved in cell wall biosynthesis